MARTAFTLIEVLVVLAIIVIAMGMSFGLVAKRDERRAQVQGAASELASTLRLARSYAMERNIVAAVSFNIENAPGSPGWSLNNRSGGHWYRILGPARARNSSSYNYAGHFPFPRSRFYQSTGSWAGGDANDSPFRCFLEAVDSAWYGDRHVLPAGKVRLLAVGDQDNGCRSDDGGTYQTAGSDWFYPRPWFGRWDAAGKRLHAWGGYEPDLRDPASPARTRADGSAASFTGFFYEGKDGPIAGCVNPAERGILDDTNGDGRFKQAGSDADDQTRTFALYRKDEPRPLIDARWLDLFLIFNPDGTVQWGPPFAARREWGDREVTGGLYSQGRGVFGAASVHLIGPGDRVGHQDALGPYAMYEISNYTAHTGAWYITLAPDLPAGDADLGRFPALREAVASLLPMFRVWVTPGGEIGYGEVKRALPAGTALDGAVDASKWRDGAFLKSSYTDGSLRGSDYAPRGRPAAEYLTPDMLATANWWLP